MKSLHELMPKLFLSLLGNDESADVGFGEVDSVHLV